MNGNNANSLDTVRVNPKLRADAEYIFEKMGMTTTEAFDIFLAQVVNTRSLPFRPKVKKEYVPKLSEEYVDAKLKEAEDELAAGAELLDGFQVLERLKQKYGG
jgi:addiction module RelB/DinJ family antitoxin